MRDSPSSEGEIGTREMLTDTRQRYLLYCLYLYRTPVRLSEVAYQLSVWEAGDPSTDIATRRHRIYMALYHEHVPALADADIVTYDQQQDTLELTSPDIDLLADLEAALSAEFDDLLDAEADAYGDYTPRTLPDDLYRVLTSPLRRELLAYLLETPQNSLSETARTLATRVESSERADCETQREIRTALHHTHLPLLADIGIVTYDRDDGTIQLRSLPGPVREVIRSAHRHHQMGNPERGHTDSDQ